MDRYYEEGIDTLTATVAPSNTTNKAVTWTSSNPNVATVNNGVITAVSVGTAIITATIADGNKSASCSVTVNNSKFLYLSSNSINDTDKQSLKNALPNVI
jgi:Bacterial surface proteins containing Ig-like domains